MPFYNGVFTRLRSWVADKAAGLFMQPDLMDQDANDIAAALSNCLLRDGTGGPTADIPWGSKRVTSLGDPQGAQDAVNLRTMQGSVNGAACQLVLQGQALVLMPRNGNGIVVNGALVTIPDAGISLASGPSALPAGLNYLYAVGGTTPTLIASQTGHVAQGGVEVMSGDPTKRFVGSAYVSGGTFYDTPNLRLVRSWFNDTGIRGSRALSTTLTVQQDAPSELNGSADRVQFLAFAGETVEVTMVGQMASLAAGGGGRVACGLDGIYGNQSSGASYMAGSNFVGTSLLSFTSLSEGLHYASMYGFGDNGNSCSFASGSTVLRVSTSGRR